MSLSPDPLVTVVTPVYNMARYLPLTIESVLAQDYPAIEYIVADGGSTDGTLEILERFSGRLRYFSGKDKGPSDAISRAFQQARGEVLAWLNADDLYLRRDAITTAVDRLRRSPEVDVVYGEGYWIDENGAVLRRYPTLQFDARVLARDCFICQPASFFLASAYRQCGLDPDVNQSFDYDLWIRMAKHGLRFASIPDYLAGSRMHSQAKTIRERSDVFDASMRLLSRHYGYVPFSWVFGHTAFRLDGRDQFFEPLQPSLKKYLLALPAGLRMNRSRPIRFFAEWLAAPARAVCRRLAQRNTTSTQ